jgi:hypothetical protein
MMCYRTISFIAHTAKIVAKILRIRIEKKIEDVLGEVSGNDMYVCIHINRGPALRVISFHW